MNKILIIEDDRKITKSLAIRLTANGFQVRTAEDAMAGERAALRERPDLILLDIGVPGGGGFRVMEQFHRHPATSATPVIFITASKRPEFRGQAQEMGATAFFEKPFDTADLLAAIREALLPGQPAAGGT